MKFTSFLPLAVVTLTLAACGTQSTPVTDTTDQTTIEPTNQALQIVTTFAPLYQHTLNLVDENDTVTNLVPAGTSIHDWQPSPRDIASLEAADIIVINGLDLEEFLEDSIHELEDKGIMIVDTSVTIEAIEFDEYGDEHHDDHEDEHDHEEEGHDEDDMYADDVHDEHDDEEDEHDHEEDEHEDDHDDHDDNHGHHHDGVDPHIWLSVPNAQQQSNTIAQALIQADPSSTSNYEANLTSYQSKLAQLDTEIRDMIAAADVQNFVVFHDAYGYYMREYGLLTKQVDMVLEHHNDTPTQAEIAELIQNIQTNNVAKIFIEPQFRSTIVDAIKQETNLTVGTLNPIGSQMDADGYIANMKDITNALIQ